MSFLQPPTSRDVSLPIFSLLDSKQLVLCRRTCKDWLDIIDSNKSLWRVLDWVQEDEESPGGAIDMFSLKSSNSLKSVSILERKRRTTNGENPHGQLHLYRTLLLSKSTLESVTLRPLRGTQDLALEIFVSSPRMKTFKWWPLTGGGGMPRSPGELPAIRLVPFSRRVAAHSSGATSESRLTLLWFCSRKILRRLVSEAFKLDSLISFAYPFYVHPQDYHALASKFSKTIVHLQLGLDEDEEEDRHEGLQSLVLPNLQILRGYYPKGVPKWLKCPQLRMILFEHFNQSALDSLPLSIKEMFLLHRVDFSDDDWKSIKQVAPLLRVLKITDTFWKGFVGSYPSDPPLSVDALIDVLEERERMVQKGLEIGGIKLVSLQKLIIPIELLDPKQLYRVRELASEVIDVKAHPEVIEVEY